MERRCSIRPLSQRAFGKSAIFGARLRIDMMSFYSSAGLCHDAGKGKDLNPCLALQPSLQQNFFAVSGSGYQADGVDNHLVQEKLSLQATERTVADEEGHDVRLFQRGVRIYQRDIVQTRQRHGHFPDIRAC